MPKQEHILCSAIWFNDDMIHPHQPINVRTGLVFCGYGHANIFPQIGGRVSDRQEFGYIAEEQGFLTSTNRFVGREEAAKIAYACGQINEEKSRLFSEDLH